MHKHAEYKNSFMKHVFGRECTADTMLVAAGVLVTLFIVCDRNREFYARQTLQISPPLMHH